MKDYFNRCCDKTYIAHTDEFTFIGILVNYHFGNIILFNEEREEICHIPFNELKGLRPFRRTIKNSDLPDTNDNTRIIFNEDGMQLCYNE